MALLLKKKGIERVRPLQGGLDAWRERGYPIVNAEEIDSGPPLSPAAK